MNLPNKLTLSRLLAVVLIVILYAIFKDAIWTMYTIFGLFILASLTDFLDGKIARKYNLVTGFGKLADPLADKLLVLSTILILYDLHVIPYLWLIIIIIAREIIVSGIRLCALEGSGNVVAAGMTGKIKTFSQMVSVIGLLFVKALSLSVSNGFINALYWIFMVIFFISAAFSVESCVEYFIKNKNNFKTK